MKIPKIIKLPSGSWFCQIRIDGKSVSITDEDRDTVEAKAYAYKAGILKLKKSPERVTLGQAMDRYIADRENILSPATIREYRRYQRSDFGDIINKQVCDINKSILQKVVNKMARDLSPKTVRNKYFFILSVIKSVYPDIVCDVVLPQKKKYTSYAPTEADITALIAHVKGKPIEVPILLSAFGSLRRSEICALTVDDIRPNGVYVNKAMVKDGNGKWVIKSTKTTESERLAELPAEVVEIIRQRAKDGMITKCSPNVVTNGFIDAIQKTNIPKFRFHDLRHYWVSIAHAVGMPDLYIMHNGGWTTMQTPQKIYMSLMPDVVEPKSNEVIRRFAKQLNDSNS